MQTDDVLMWVCQYCGEENELWADLTLLEQQDIIEDCELCCRPNRVIITHDKDDDELIYIDARLTDE
ncbi:MAG TPA: CPXCG motif-containing cysteine-rich protein [Ignavibacteriaceae bacterium]|nr:CPXCG motif-containing cysteine-rich protein [Ignavibacteriaceae bacterium]